MPINKYSVRMQRRLSEKLEKIKILPFYIRYFGISDIKHLGNEEIVLDVISDVCIPIWFFKNSDIGSQLYFNGCFEKDEINLIKKILPTDGTVLDIGANIGYHSLIMSKIVDTKGKIYSFEPYSKNFKMLNKNKQLNSFTNIETYKLAIGDQNKKIMFNIFEDYAYNSILDTKRKKHIGIEKVSMVTLDSFVFSRKFKKIDFIKIDVEGFELNVLMGAKRVLKRFKPKIICEIDRENLNPLKIKVIDVIDYVRSFNYDCYLIQGEKLIPIGSKKDNFQYYNFCFISK